MYKIVILKKNEIKISNIYLLIKCNIERNIKTIIK